MALEPAPQLFEDSASGQWEGYEPWEDKPPHRMIRAKRKPYKRTGPGFWAHNEARYQIAALWQQMNTAERRAWIPTARQLQLQIYAAVVTVNHRRLRDGKPISKLPPPIA